MMFDKNLLGFLAMFFTLLSNFPYIWSMLKGKTRPHVFSWIVWTLAAAIVFAAQYVAEAGPGAWATGLSALLGIIVLSLSLTQKADWSITRSDWVAFFGALAIIPIWYATDSAMIAAVLATMIDTLAYYPTFRKSYHKPHQEMVFAYLILSPNHIASIYAMTQYSLTTLVMPVTMLIMNNLLIAILLWRRHVLAHSADVVL